MIDDTEFEIRASGGSLRLEVCGHTPITPHSIVELEISLGAVRLPISEICDLRPQTILDVSLPAVFPVSVRCGAALLAKGEASLQGSDLMVRIVDAKAAGNKCPNEERPENDLGADTATSAENLSTPANEALPQETSAANFR